MLSAAENELITRVGPGTPMGEVFRRVWLPVLASDDARADGAPLRLRILNEDLVAFRDTDGALGVLRAACPHRRAKLFWGRNEEQGLRCAYHGWKFAVDGRCLDLPSEPASSHLRDHVSAKSFPVVEHGGLAWVYMGPAPEPPPFPEYGWLGSGRSVATTSLQRSNWLQSLEGDLDTAHVSFLHRWLDPDEGPPAFIEGYRHFVDGDRAPYVAVRETDYGLVYGGRRNVGAEDGGEYYWRISHWVAPAASSIPGGAMRFLTPIDDYHALSCSLFPSGTADEGRPTPQPLSRYALSDGYMVDVRVLPRGPENDYDIDREVQRLSTFTGIPGGPRDQDRAITETMEPILDRSEENLGTTDRAIVVMRNQLLQLARDMDAGVEPKLIAAPHLVRDVRGWDLRTAESDFERVLTQAEHAALHAH